MPAWLETQFQISLRSTTRQAILCAVRMINVKQSSGSVIGKLIEIQTRDLQNSKSGGHCRYGNFIINTKPLCEWREWDTKNFSSPEDGGTMCHRNATTKRKCYTMQYPKRSPPSKFNRFVKIFSVWDLLLCGKLFAIPYRLTAINIE
jgi:hypothetical protein